MSVEVSLRRRSSALKDASSEYDSGAAAPALLYAFDDPIELVAAWLFLRDPETCSSWKRRSTMLEGNEIPNTGSCNDVSFMVPQIEVEQDGQICKPP